tara:strand:- start:90 stop:332 length:243 start_codon:yes stop_codon:yes gene_type:complete
MAGMEYDPLLGVASTNPLATGAPVYGNGTMQPTRGPVDRSGYAERDLKLRRMRAQAQSTANKQMMNMAIGPAGGGLPGRI